MDTWFISVFTADARGAGTDANVLLVIYGKNSKGESVKSDEIKLENKGDSFESGQVDKFKRETIDVGKPYKIRVSHDNTGSFPGWKLDRVSFSSCCLMALVFILTHVTIDKYYSPCCLMVFYFCYSLTSHQHAILVIKLVTVIKYFSSLKAILYINNIQ